MLKAVRKLLKHSLCLLPDSQYVRMVMHSPKLRSWRAAHTHAATPHFEHREQLYDHIAANHSAKDLLFLEFGCASGNSLRYWAQKVTSSEASFVGFDTFTGLPENWRGIGRSVEAGIWDLGGVPPKTDDPRISFVKGLFQETLSDFVAEGDPLGARRPLIVHIDADLYSSTLFVLTYLSRYLPGAIVIFDEFDCAVDEFRALEDYCSAYRRSYEVLGVTPWCEQVAIRFSRQDAVPGVLQEGSPRQRIPMSPTTVERSDPDTSRRYG